MNPCRALALGFVALIGALGLAAWIVLERAGRYHKDRYSLRYLERGLEQ